MKNPINSVILANTFLAKNWRYLRLLAPVSFVVTAMAIWFAVTQLNHVIVTGGQTIASQGRSAFGPKLEQKALNKVAYEEIIKVLTFNNPAVQLAVGKGDHSLIISVSDPAAMPEWMYLLSTLQSYRPGLVWRADHICLQKCDGGGAAVAELTAYTQQVTIK